LVIIALSARLLPGPRIIDDSYITYRYSRNILAGNGFVFNPGERVLGTTTPLYTLILVGIGAISGGSHAPFPLISWLLNAVIDSVACVLIWQIGKKIVSDRVGIISSLLWAVAPFSVTFSIGGLETSLYVLLLLLVSYFFINNHLIIMRLCASLMILTRPDALIFLVPLFALSIIFPSQRKIYQPHAMILAAIPLLLWIAFGFWYFGSPLPHSIAAKSVAYQLPVNAAFIRLIQHYLTPFSEQYTFGPNSLYGSLLLYPALFIFGFIAICRKNSHALGFVIYPIAYFLAFAIFHPLIFRWYLTPPLPFYYMTILAGGEALLERIAAKFMPDNTQLTSALSKWNFSNISTAVITLILLIPILLSLKGWVLKPDHGNLAPAPEMAWVKLEELYKLASNDVISATSPGAVVSAGDVGVLGYFTNRTILDTVGLNSPVSSGYYPLPEEDYVINYAIPTQLILDQKPDLIVFLEVYGRNTLLKSQDFLTKYQLIKEYPTDLYGSRGLLLYQKVD
jgi:hypothetical protein